MDIFLQNCYYPPLNEDACLFIRSNCNGWLEGSINYLEVYFCKLSAPFNYLFILALISLLISLFVFIGTTASEFFCPNLAAISNSLNLSESLSGVTLLALGNGSPDLFSTFSAMRSSAGGLAIGELIGSAAFVTTMTVGTVAFLSPFQINSYLFFRDVGFLFGALGLNFLVLWDNQITLLESILLMLYYLLYVGSVVYFDDYPKQNLNVDESAPLLMTQESSEDSISTIEQDRVSEFTSRLIFPTQGAKRKMGVLDTVALYEQMHPNLSLEDEIPSPTTFGLSELFTPAWSSLLFPSSKITSNRPKLERWFMYMLSPFYAILRLSIPVASSFEGASSIFGTEVRYLPLDLFQSFFGVIVCSVAVFDVLGIKWSLLHLFFVLLFGLSSVVIHLLLQKSQYSTKKDYICWFGFAVAMAWIYLIANEVVVILRILGFLCQISDSVLGLTLFSIGNSLGDFASNITIAKMGFPTMALTACFATPMLNLILGVGVSSAWQVFRTGTSVELDLGPSIHFTGGLLLVIVLLILFLLPAKNFNFDKSLGIFLVCLYFLIMLYAVLM